MDDDIDIEEHDILEHPQVKAAFPHLSKLEIQVHTLGASFMDETSQEEFKNLLQERPGFVDVEEDSDSTSSYRHTEFVKEHFEGRSENGEFEKEDNDVVIISDSESTAGTAEVAEESGIVDAEKQTDKLIDAVKETGNVTISNERSANDIANDQVTDCCSINGDLGKRATEEFLEISDDEPEKIDKIAVEAQNINGILEKSHKDKFIEIAGNVVFIDEDPKIYNIIEEGPRLEEIDEEVDTPNIDNVTEGPRLEQIDEKVDTPTIDNVTEGPRLEETDEEVDTPTINNITEGPIANNTFKEGPKIDEQDSVGDKFVEKPTENDSLIDKASANNLPKNKTDSEDEDEQKDTKYQIYSEAQYEEVHIKEEFDYEYSDHSINTCHDKLPPEDIFHFNNMIILGSKPSPKPSLPCKLSLVPVVLLDDWGVHLNGSKCYCHECETLFVTPNALDSHRMVAHSLLAPITNRAVKSTAQANIARKSTSNIKCREISSTFCNHCNVTFKDSTSLIKHLYERLPGARYNCNICDKTFKTHTDLLKHNSVHVKKEPRKILNAKKVEANPILRNILNKDIQTPKAIKRSYPKPVTPLPSANINLEPFSNNNDRYKCSVCDAEFDTYGIARMHRNKHHAELKEQRIILKLLHTETSPSKRLVYEEDVCVTKKVKTANNESKSYGNAYSNGRDLVPKAALFQCPRCKLNFMTSAGASVHLIRNETCAVKPCLLWSCQICKKSLLKKDANRHKIQHKLSSNIKIYKVTRNTKERTLCKCSKCRVHFEYNHLLLHYNKCGKHPTAKCLQCNIVLSKSSLELHEKRHNNEKLKQNDFIFVDYVAINGKPKPLSKKIKSEPGLKINGKSKPVSKKIKSEPGLKINGKSKPVSKKIKSEPGLKPKLKNKLIFEEDKHKLYYCKHCKCYLFGRAEQSKKAHLTKRCLERLVHKCYNCDKCGLKIARGSKEFHKKMHSENNFTLKDIDFLDFATLKRITPPLPAYPCCRKCNIHFLNKKLLRKHICGEDYDNCNVCGMMYENSLLGIHMSFHEAAFPRPEPSSPKIMPELMMKYESLNAIWNILFSCGNCHMVSDMYNRAVEHSQSHLNKENLAKTIKCYVCGLKFDESSWSKHSALHSRMKLDKKSFKILKYEPERLLDESWFQMFESLPEKEIRQILDRSVFGNERSLKMKLVKDGLPEFTIYCCSICGVSYDNASILNHVHSKCKEFSHLCKPCDVVFHDASALQFHQLLHKKGIKAEEFRIIQFVKVIDIPKPRPTKMKLVKRTMKVNKSEALGRKHMKGGKESTNSSRYVLYKCENCSVCVHNKSNSYRHMCRKSGYHWFCEICKQNFLSQNKPFHIKVHGKVPKMSARNIRIVCFGASSRKSTKCEKTNATSQPKSNAHVTKQNAKNAASPKTDAEHSLSSHRTDKLKSRKTLNSSKSSINISYESDSDVQGKRTATLYKCDCGLHFTTSRSIDAHMKRCSEDNELSNENCSKCGLLFPTDVLVSHLCKHHSQKTEITVKEVQKKKSDTNHIKLYKCSDCNVYFLNQNSCYKHVNKHEALDAKEFIECKMCCLQFRILSLHVHMKKHHETPFDLDRVLVEEYHPSVGKQAPKIDIYFASDRFVSSSNGND